MLNFIFHSLARRLRNTSSSILLYNKSSVCRRALLVLPFLISVLVVGCAGFPLEVDHRIDVGVEVDYDSMRDTVEAAMALYEDYVEITAEGSEARERIESIRHDFELLRELFEEIGNVETEKIVTEK